MSSSEPETLLGPEDKLQGDRITLRLPRWEDMQFIQWLWGDPQTMEPVGGPVELTDDRAREQYAGWTDPERSTGCYCLIFNEANQPVGEISFRYQDQESMTANLNLKIAHKERRKGYAGEAMAVFLSYFFNNLGGRVLVDGVALENKAGQQALLRFGFEHDPGVDKVFLLRLTRERFNALHGSTKASRGDL